MMTRHQFTLGYVTRIAVVRKAEREHDLVEMTLNVKGSNREREAAWADARAALTDARSDLAEFLYDIFGGGGR